MNFVVDCILVSIVLFGALLGIKRGFVKTIAKPVKLILTLVIAFSFAAPVSDALVEPRVREPLANQMEVYIVENCVDINADNIKEELPTLLKIGAGVFDIDVEKLARENPDDSLVNKICDSLIAPATSLVSTAITFILLYLLSSILLSILLSILGVVVDDGFIGVFNRILGGIFSTAFAFILAWALTSVFTYVINLPSVATSDFASKFSGGFIYKFFNSLNPIELLLSF